MCTTCGCGTGETHVDGKALSGPGNVQATHSASVPPPNGEGAGEIPAGMSYRAVGARHGQAHLHADGRRHVHDHDHAHDAAHGHAHASVAAQGSATTPSRLIQIERDILARNDGYAAENRRRFDEQGIFALNLVSSPGSGKTSLLCRTIEALQEQLPIAVIEGDQQTSRDTERIRETGVPALQINTGKGCHLDARSIDTALDQLDIASLQLLFIENVGNLVCPAAFDLGESLRVVVLAITEGEDKPLKYPDMFYDADVVLLNKMDLLPHLEVNLDDLYDNLKQIQPHAVVLPISAQTGEGIEGWIEWLTQATRKFTSA